MALLRKKNKTVAVVGLGYVGLPLALLAGKKGYGVIGLDIDEGKVRLVNEKKSPFNDPAIARQMRRSRIQATSDFGLVREADVVVVCVPTPVNDDHSPDLFPLTSACKNIAPNIRSGALIIIESTINPGVCESVVIPLIEEGSGFRAGKDFLLAHCPERIDPGNDKWNVENISRVVGGFNDESMQRALSFYSAILDARVKCMSSLKEAEAVKVVENAFRDVNIAFVNELAMSFNKLGIDVLNVIEGASTKPFSFMPHYPGCGVGGHCIPVDPYYLIDYAEKNGFKHKFLSLARRINNRMPSYTVSLLEQVLAERDIPIKDAKIAVLGLAYKPNIGDCRESPSFCLIEEIDRRGGWAASFDPFAIERGTARSLEDALEGAAGAIVATAHNVFRALSPDDFSRHGIQAVIDGRNCLSSQVRTAPAFAYRGIGI
ncbi:nucleotide sugar dehydrogenase [bacterium]|nr:nucleotide sugar dehydrogenase [bacterium]